MMQFYSGYKFKFFSRRSTRSTPPTLVAKLTAPRPVNGGLPSYSSDSEPMQPCVISSSKPIIMRSMNETPLIPNTLI